MKIGFDYSGTMDTYPSQFTIMGQAIQAQGGKVYIISAVGTGDLEFSKVIESEFPWVDEVITHEANDNVPQQKLEIARDRGIEVFFDDRKDICDHFNLNGILAFRVWRVGQEL